ncbi:MAG TPA: hypothetical protein VHH34_24700 [Pseudonocardiaceae bacterium]|nr:hypothetical protein [Pseudonocardiaceae bacterium]
MSVLALSTPAGEPMSGLAVAVVALGLLGFLVGTALRVKRRA